MTNTAASTSTGASSSTAKQKTQQPTLEIKDKLRVLCLHGYRQNGDAFKSKVGSFRKHVAKYAEFVFITAPHQALPLEPGIATDPEQRSWWSNKDDGTFKGTNKGGPAFGFQESLRVVEQAWKEQGPFQGLFGFSQGACFVGLICGLSKKKLTSIKPEFAILSSGFKSGSLVHKSAYEELITIPTLHVYGSTDEIIPMAMSRELMEHFEQIQMLEHVGGHYFPSTVAQKQTYINYFQDRLQDHLEHLELKNSTNSEFLEEDLMPTDGSDVLDSDDD